MDFWLVGWSVNCINSTINMKSKYLVAVCAGILTSNITKKLFRNNLEKLYRKESLYVPRQTDFAAAEPKV